MSYKSLLFCPDEATARLVTQVLSELEFTVELSFEPTVTVRKLSEEHFDALVVDCHDEQNASLLFKGARDSALNHSSLCVAVVDGQAGLAKAFRIGANLVLTKPINVEQSKNTLRVAKGLLRKNAGGKPPASPALGGQGSESKADSTHAGSPSVAPTVAAPQIPATPPVAAMSANPPSPPFSSIEVEREKSPEVPAEDAAVLESLPELGKAKVSSPPPPVMSRPAGISVGFSGQAAAPALASDTNSTAEKSKVTPIRTAAPLATQEPIFPEHPSIAKAEPAAPVFSSYADQSSATRGSGKVIWIFIALLVVGAGGYFGWQKFQPMRYLRARMARANADQAAANNQPSTPTIGQTPPAGAATPTPISDNSPAANSAGGTAQPASIAPNSAPEGFPTKEKIDVNDSVPADAETVVTVVEKPKPLQVNNRPSRIAKANGQPEQPVAPPAISLSANNNADSALAGIVTSNAVLPKAAPGTLQISQGITQGLLVKRVSPIYPPAALQLRKQGTVELLAKVSKAGDITAIRVLSGDATLARAAADAVRQWKYRPYLLNSEPVEIETQVTVKFNLPH